jgi:hypothetical protein
MSGWYRTSTMGGDVVGRERKKKGTVNGYAVVLYQKVLVNVLI